MIYLKNKFFVNNKDCKFFFVSYTLNCSAIFLKVVYCYEATLYSKLNFLFLEALASLGQGMSVSLWNAMRSCLTYESPPSLFTWVRLINVCSIQLCWYVNVILKLCVLVGTRSQRSSWSAFGRSTGNDVSGHKSKGRYFSRPSRTFWGPLVAILDLQTVRHCKGWAPQRR